MDCDFTVPTNNGFRESLLAIAIEAWRFRDVCQRIIENHRPDSARFESKSLYFFGQIERALCDAGLRAVSLEGERYDPGMAVTAVNLDGFDAEDTLVVDKMIEPILMEGATVARMGVVRLRRESE